MKRSIVLSVVLLLAASVGAFSQTVSYDVEVTEVSGPHAALFPARERLLVSYTLNAGVTDANSDPSRGEFHNAVLSMAVSFPGIGVFANTGAAGLAQTFNNFGTCKISDQVFIHGGPISSASTLGGETLNSVEVDFLSEFVVTPVVPFMLSNDSLPVTNLGFHEAFVIFRTASGNTFVHFDRHPPERIQSLSDQVTALENIGVLTPAQANRLTNQLDAALRALERGNTTRACTNLRDFIDRVNALIDDGVLSPAGGQRFIDTARSIRGQLGC